MLNNDNMDIMKIYDNNDIDENNSVNENILIDIDISLNTSSSFFEKVNYVKNDLLDHLKVYLKYNNNMDVIYYLNEEILEFIDLFNNEYSLCIAEENYYSLLFNNIHEMLLILLERCNYNYNENNENYISWIINDIFEEALSYYHVYMYPKRSYKNTFIRKKPNIESIDKKLDIIRNIPQPEQRTSEWFQFRNTLISASSAWKTFSSEAVRNQLIYEKCKPYQDRSNSYVNTDSTLHWGQKYEPLSVMIYENKYNTIIEDFGCIKHRDYDFVGASPDGINISRESERYGRMLEIKNIVNRDITKIPKKEYWIQMQLQMEVCDLNECDFLETKFTEYKDKEDFIQDGTFNLTNNNNKKGIILQFNNNSNPLYEYAPIDIDKENYNVWYENQIQKHYDKQLIKTLYWKLDIYSCILVLRNKHWFKSAVYELENIWNIILKEKNNGYEHRAPKKKNKKECVCLIKIPSNNTTNITDTTNTINTTNTIINSDNNINNGKIIKIRTESIDETINDIEINKIIN